MVFQGHSLHFGLWWQNCLNNSVYISWFPLSCSHVHKVISMPTTAATAFKDAVCSSCLPPFSPITVWRLQLCSLTNFFHHRLSETNLYMLKIVCFFPKYITVMEDVFALWFPISFWLNLSISPLMFYILMRHLLAESPFQSFRKVSSDLTQKISPQVKVLYQNRRSCTSQRL